MDCGTTERLFRSIARNAAQGVSLGKRKSKRSFILFLIAQISDGATTDGS